MQEHFKSFISSQPPLSSPTSSFSICYRWQCDKYFFSPLPPSCTLSFLYTAAHLPILPPPFPLSHFISLHLRLQFPSAPFPQSDRLSLRRPPSPSRCFKSSLYGSGSVNLAGIFSYRFLFFFAIVCKKWKCVKYSKHISYVESSYISTFKQTCR